MYHFESLCFYSMGIWWYVCILIFVLFVIDGMLYDAVVLVHAVDLLIFEAFLTFIYFMHLAICML